MTTEELNKRNALDVASADMKTDDDGVRILLVGGGEVKFEDGPPIVTETFTVEVGKVPERSIYAPPEKVMK